VYVSGLTRAGGFSLLVFAATTIGIAHAHTATNRLLSKCLDLVFLLIIVNTGYFFTTACFVTSMSIMTIIMDAYGTFGYPVRSYNHYKGLGVLLVVFGAIYCNSSADIRPGTEIWLLVLALTAALLGGILFPLSGTSPTLRVHFYI
jgi:hypothetical protein